MKGIMFKEELLNQILRGNKTQTRRIVKSDTPYDIHMDQDGMAYEIVKTDEDGFEYDPVRKVKHKYDYDEVVYLKEPWFENEDGSYSYKYNGDCIYDNRWNNKMFMPERAARGFIKITAVGLERLMDIDNNDAWCEGVSNSPEYDCVALFRSKWEDINGDRS